MAFVPPARAAQDFSHPDTRPSPQAGLVQQANDAIAAGNFAAALTLLTTLNTQIPNDPQVLYDLGFTLESLPSATPPSSLTPESCYRASIAADPGFAPSHAALGLLLARANHPAEARAQLLAATQLPAEPALEGRALRAIARIDLAGIPGDAEHAVAPNPAAASDDLLAALKLTREQPADILLSAEIAEAAADLPAAEQAYRRYLALPGNNADPAPTAALVHVLLAERHYAEAEAVLGPALARDPGNPSLTAQLAEADLASGDDAQIAKAVPMVEALRAKNPGSPVLTRLLARVYVETGHPDEADPLYAALLSTDPAHPDPTLLVDRAETLLLLHRPGEAERLLKQAVANPAAFPAPAAFADAATQLAFAASEIDDPRTTLQALALRATVQPPSPSSLFLEATANDDLHQSSKAAELYKQFLAAAHGTLPDQESQVRKRLAELDSRK
jgi:Tfp pilus assembly protein PilF